MFELAHQSQRGHDFKVAARSKTTRSIGDEPKSIRDVTPGRDHARYDWAYLWQAQRFRRAYSLPGLEVRLLCWRRGQAYCWRRRDERARLTVGTHHEPAPRSDGLHQRLPGGREDLLRAF